MDYFVEKTTPTTYKNQTTKTRKNSMHWLDGEREGTWQLIASIDKNTPLGEGKANSNFDIEISIASCCQAVWMTWFILRFNNGEDGFHYMACCLVPDQNTEINVPVSRTEKPSGEVINQDKWDKNFEFAMKVSKMPDLSKAITVGRNFAQFNNYSYPPPYVFKILQEISPEGYSATKESKSNTDNDSKSEASFNDFSDKEINKISKNLSSTKVKKSDNSLSILLSASIFKYTSFTFDICIT